MKRGFTYIEIGNIYGCLTVVDHAGYIEYASEERKAFKVRCRFCQKEQIKCNRNIVRTRNDYCSKECRKLNK